MASFRWLLEETLVQKKLNDYGIYGVWIMTTKTKVDLQKSVHMSICERMKLEGGVFI